jgi:hypothetical protein
VWGTRLPRALEAGRVKPEIPFLHPFRDLEGNFWLATEGGSGGYWFSIENLLGRMIEGFETRRLFADERQLRAPNLDRFPIKHDR